MNHKRTVGIYTLGCRVNLYESCAISERLKERGFEVSKSAKCDYYIVNTCAVTAESERKSRQMVRRCAAKGKVLVIGCGAQLSPDSYDIENVIYVCGNREKMSVADVICGDAEIEKLCTRTMVGAPYEQMALYGKDELFSECRAFVKIQDGCNGKCTYCIIPKCRGSVRSRDAAEVVEEAKRLVENGYNEIILTGIEVGAYNKMPLSGLITKLSEIKGLKRLRLGSLSPNVVSDKFLEEVSKSRVFMPHVHLSLQSCSDRVLKMMARPYRKDIIFERVNAIRRFIPNCMISADIIVGFPGETEADFLETLNALRELNIFHVHSFPYSEREGTPAATMDGSVPKSIRSERNARLIASNNQTRKAILDSLYGKVCSVLVEKIQNGYAFGHTESFLEAKFAAFNISVGDFVSMKIDSNDGTALIGTAICSEE